jgi:hypothetical protein
MPRHDANQLEDFEVVAARLGSLSGGLPIY